MSRQAPARYRHRENLKLISFSGLPLVGADGRGIFACGPNGTEERQGGPTGNGKTKNEAVRFDDIEVQLRRVGHEHP
jgi:hypothetical protein